MPTTVVNIRHETCDVYCGRAGKGMEGPLGNPFRVQEHGAKALEMFDEYFLKRVEEDAAFRDLVLSAKGKKLGCFCRPKSGFRGKYRCHAQRVCAFLEGIRPEDVA